MLRVPLWRLPLKRQVTWLVSGGKSQVLNVA